MIEYIKGILQLKQPHRVVIENNNIGYEILVPFSTSKDMPEQGKQVKLLTYLNWRQEGSPQLIGFASEDERQLFKILTSVNKVGAKMALNIMSATTPEQFATMILSEDTKRLTSLKGVGSKLASRLVVELKENIAKLGIGNKEQLPLIEEEKHIIPFEEDVREALESLGYTSKEITACLKKISKDIPATSSLEEIVAAVLRSFAS